MRVAQPIEKSAPGSHDPLKLGAYGAGDPARTPLFRSAPFIGAGSRGSAILTIQTLTFQFTPINEALLSTLLFFYGLSSIERSDRNLWNVRILNWTLNNFFLNVNVSTLTTFDRCQYNETEFQKP